MMELIKKFNGEQGAIKHNHVAQSNDKENFEREIVWGNVMGFVVMHILSAWGLIKLFTEANFLTLLYTGWLGIFVTIGITVGAHRYWSHKSFKATTPLRLILMIVQTMAGQNCIWIWARDHRMHHKYSDTDADPHNSSRGFFFSHMGWLMSKKHPELIEKGKHIDMSDLNADKIVMFQKKYYYYLYLPLSVVLPTLVPVYFWNESLWTSFLATYWTRIAFQLHGTWCVNSWAHKYGSHPYTRKLPAVESTFVGVMSFGEGWHNYHHTFPWDYKASEYGKFNWSADWIDFFAKFGWAYDRRSATKDMITYRSNKYGDGTYNAYGREGTSPPTMEKPEYELPQEDLFAEHLLKTTIQDTR